MDGYKNQLIMEKTYECCPHCGKEVELDAELKVQKCPNCGRYIVTCSMCINGDDGDEHICTQHCCLEVLANKMNEEYFPKKKFVIRHYWRQWVDIVVEAHDEDEAFDIADTKYDNGDYEELPDNFENTDIQNVTDIYERNNLPY